ncbi:MAG: dipeptide epimerase [Devosiaceae bacterium]|nr:dipeptide epimerase [Devosiaceae bacterium MH13]
MSRSTRSLGVRHDRFAIAGGFTISRGHRTHADVVTATITDGEAIGRGECTPYTRYGENVEGVIADIERLGEAIADGLDRVALQNLLPSGAARNALDCALWDLEAKASGQPVASLAGLPNPTALTTAFTLSVGDPEAMAKAAWENRHRPLLKVKLAGDGDLERMEAVCGHAGSARVIVDANEAWQPENLWDWLERAASLGLALVEQPLPASDDAILSAHPRPVPVCADESAHDRTSLTVLKGRYDYVNIKLDKAGGLTEGIAMLSAARDQGFGVFVGCMMGSSLAMAPAFLLATQADYVDLDAPLLLSEDRDPRLAFNGSTIEPPSPELWG